MNGLQAFKRLASGVALWGCVAVSPAAFASTGYVLDTTKNVVYTTGGTHYYGGSSDHGALPTALIISGNTYQFLDGNAGGINIDPTPMTTTFFTASQVLDVTLLQENFAYLRTVNGNYVLNIRTNVAMPTGGTRYFQGFSDFGTLQSVLIVTPGAFQFIDGNAGAQNIDPTAFNTSYFSGSDIVDVTTLQENFAYLDTTKGNFVLDMRKNLVYPTGGTRYFQGYSDFGTLPAEMILSGNTFQVIDGNAGATGTPVTTFDTTLFSAQDIQDVTLLSGHFAYLTVNDSVPVPVPEASTLSMAIAGVGFLGLAMRRNRRSSLPARA